MVCIIDDREDVWKFAPNLITVKKYIYFQGTGDINAPPGSREAQMAKKGTVPTHLWERDALVERPRNGEVADSLCNTEGQMDDQERTVQWVVSSTVHIPLWEALLSEVNKHVSPVDSLILGCSYKFMLLMLNVTQSIT